MLLSEFITALDTLEEFRFRDINGAFIPPHFHITEVGMIRKHFIDCGGTERKESTISFQLWSSDDIYHRLKPQKVIDIIRLSQKRLGITDGPLEIEYQAQTIGRYDISFDGDNFQLLSKQTNCLAIKNCCTEDSPAQNTQKSSCCTASNGC
ncbi:MAG: DUF6428 family protein [Flavobacteriaceae bacterium]